MWLFLIPPSILIPFKIQIRRPFSKNFLFHQRFSWVNEEKQMSSDSLSLSWWQEALQDCHLEEANFPYQMLFSPARPFLRLESFHSDGAPSPSQLCPSAEAWSSLSRGTTTLLQDMVGVKEICVLQCSLPTRLPITLASTNCCSVYDVSLTPALRLQSLQFLFSVLPGTPSSLQFQSLLQ